MTISAAERPDSGSIQNAGQGRIVQRRYTYRKDFNWEAEMPAIGANVAGLRYVRGYSSEPDAAYVVVTVTYGAADSYIPQNSDDVYTFDATADERDIELHPDFLMMWKYDLWVVTGGSAAVPAWATTATDASDADGQTYLWSVEHPGDGWFRIQLRTKPGNLSYLVPRDVVRYARYRSSYSSATGLKGATGQISTPGQTFSVTGGNWLVTSSSVKRANGLWVCETEYTHGTWDTDIYSAAGTVTTTIT